MPNEVMKNNRHGEKNYTQAAQNHTSPISKTD